MFYCACTKISTFIIIIIIFTVVKFSVLSSVSSKPSSGLCLRPSLREDSDYMYSMYLCFMLPILVDIFQSH